MVGPSSRRDDSSSSQFGEWTVMGIIKRLDDQRRVIDMVRTEMEQLKSARAENVSKNAAIQEPGELARNIETALVANKQLADSMIKLREAISRLVTENERLRQDVEALKVEPLQKPHLAQTDLLREAHLRMLRAVSTGAKSSTEISRVIGRSREHTSRMARRMVELGVFERKMDRYTPKYALTEAGNAILKDSETTSLRQNAIP